MALVVPYPVSSINKNEFEKLLKRINSIDDDHQVHTKDLLDLYDEVNSIEDLAVNFLIEYSERCKETDKKLELQEEWALETEETIDLLDRELTIMERAVEIAFSEIEERIESNEERIFELEKQVDECNEDLERMDKFLMISFLILFMVDCAFAFLK